MPIYLPTHCLQRQHRRIQQAFAEQLVRVTLVSKADVGIGEGTTRGHIPPRLVGESGWERNESVAPSQLQEDSRIKGLDTFSDLLL